MLRMQVTIRDERTKSISKSINWLPEDEGI